MFRADTIHDWLRIRMAFSALYRKPPVSYMYLTENYYVPIDIEIDKNSVRGMDGEVYPFVTGTFIVVFENQGVADAFFTG